MLNEIQAVIFDLDGTMADSMKVWTDIDIHFFESRNMEFPPDLQKAIEGMSFTETAAYFIERFQLPETVEELKATWGAQAIDEYRDNVKVKKGVRSFLEYLRASGIKVGIATSNSRSLVDAFLEANGLTDYIDHIVTSCEVCAGKPAPDVYLKAAELLDTKPEHCLVFEDIPMGILAGKNAKMRVCAVEDTYSLGMTEEKKKLADYYICDFDDVLNQNYEVLA